MSVLRPLPAVPNLEFERKEAKALLRRLRKAGRASIERAKSGHAAFAETTPPEFRLADAQLTIAREY